jgi:hypothetical protein
MGTGVFPGIKRSGREVNHSSPSSVFMVWSGKVLPSEYHAVYPHHIVKKYVEIIKSFLKCDQSLLLGALISVK